MASENRWSKLSDDEVFSAEQNISDYTAEGQQAILKEAQGRRDLLAEQSAPSHDSQAEAWVCGNCGEQIEGDYEICWSCQTDRGNSIQENNELVDTEELPALSGRPKRLIRSLGEQLEKRYRDAYRVARATTMIAGVVKFIGISLAVIGVVGAWGVAGSSTEIAVLVGILGVSAGIMVFGVGVMIAAQGQHLLAAVDDVVGSSPFLTDPERAGIMRLDFGDEG